MAALPRGGFSFDRGLANFGGLFIPLALTGLAGFAVRVWAGEFLCCNV